MISWDQFWDRIKEVWKKKKEQTEPENQIEIDEQKIAQMRVFFEMKGKLLFREHLVDEMFSNYREFDINGDSFCLIRAKIYSEILDKIESVTEEKILIAEENLRLLKGK